MWKSMAICSCVSLSLLVHEGPPWWRSAAAGVRMDGASGAARRLGRTASPPLQERPGAAAAAAEGMRRGGNSHPAAGKRAQPPGLAAPTASALEDYRHTITRFHDTSCFKRRQIFARGRQTGRSLLSGRKKTSLIVLWLEHGRGSVQFGFLIKQDGFGAGNTFNRAALNAITMNFNKTFGYLRTYIPL